MQILMPVTLLWISVFLFRLNFVNAAECDEMILKYEPTDLLALSDCTSILGSLTIMSMQDLNTDEAIAKYQFPKLKEITGYLLLFNLIGLNSTGRLFPNLTVIRGQKLIQSYSLIIFSAPFLTEIGFKSLISIQRGHVFIERCPSLCYQNTIDWEALTEEDETDLGAGKGNIIQEAAPKCPTKESCRSCENDNCWSAYHCQKNKTSNLLKAGVKCHKLCLGGCVNGTAEGCNVCTKLKLNGKCVEECPSDLFLFRDTMRCITKQRCMKARLIPFHGECRRICPDMFSQFNPATKKLHVSECFPCEIKCTQRCYGSEINGLSNLEYFRGCNIVEGSLSIKLGLSMTDINEKLEETLGGIETINGALKIYRSFSLTSLSFFRSLTKINADNATPYTRDGTLEYRNPYAIQITENDNLQTLFDWKEKLQFEIIGGGMSFHSNAKLCMNEIHSLQNVTVYDRSHDSIEYDTNGYDETCHATGIKTFHVVQSHSSVRIYWNISDFGSNRRLIGYFVYYIEAPATNITYFSGLDACSTKKFRHSASQDMPMISKKRHSEVWQSVFIPFEDLTVEKTYFEMTLTDLKQYTQYAYYIRTQLSLQHKDQLINVTQGQSQVKYFRTLPDRPRSPIVRTKGKTNVTITLEWSPSTPEHELVQKYFIDVYVLIDVVDELDKRNYCHNPKENTHNKREDVVKTPEVICCRDQRAYLEFFQRDSNQTCGESDPSCESTYKFVLFHHHVESALLMADSNKRYQFKAESHESPPDHMGTMDPIKRRIGQHNDHSKFYLHSHIIEDKHTDSVLVPNLKPFNLYAFHVYACNNISNCSDYYFHSDRTEPYRSADDIGITAQPDEHRTDMVTLIVQPPIEPNGVTVAYEIESYDSSRNIVIIKCITRRELEAMNYTIRFENLLSGSHSFRVRSLSLGDDGNFSDLVVLEVDGISNDKYNWGIALAFIVIILIIVIATVYGKCSAYRNPRVRDIYYLLHERRDSDEQSTVQQAEIVSKVPTSRPVPYSSEGDRQQRRPPVVAERLQMTVFKSSATVSPDEPSTSSDPRPTMFAPMQESTVHSQPETSFVRRIFRSFQADLRNDDQTAGLELDDTSMEDALLSRSLETHRRSTDESESEFRLFPE